MKSKGMFTIATCLLGSALALGQVAMAQQPGAAPQGAPPPALGPREVTVTEIPGVVAAGAEWTRIYKIPGNSADGIIATADGGILTAQEDPNSVTKIDKNDKSSVFL